MINKPQTISTTHIEPSGNASPAWWLVFIRELADLWIGGKAVILIFLYSIVLGVISWVMASNSELSLIPPKEMATRHHNVMAVSSLA
jgi:hypothetical protein